MHSQILELSKKLLSLPPEQYVGLALATSLLVFLYRLALHPLSRFLGPKIAACTSFYYLYWIYKGRLPEHLNSLFKQYDTDVIRIAPGQLVFRTPQAFKDIATAKEAYRGPFNFQLIGFTSKNLSNVKDPIVHRRKRKIMNLGFSAGTLAQQEPTLIIPIVDKLIDRLSEVSGNVINLGDYMDCVTTDVIGKLAFGGDFHMLDELEKHSFLHVLPKALKMSIIAQALPPFYRLLNAIYAFGPKFLTPKSLRGVADFAAYQMHARTERDKEMDDSEKFDIISVIINGIETSKDPELHMEQRELLGEATTLVAAGGDTAASAIAVTMWHLVTHRDILQDIQQQVRAKFATSEEMTSKMIQTEVPLIDAAISESTRLTPVTPGPLWRSTDKPMMIDGHLVPGNTNIGAARLSIWHDEKSFHKPTEFIPQRWIDETSTDHLDAFQPWGLGARTCIGRQMAMVEMRLILAKMLWNFDWEVLTKTFDNPDFAVLYRDPLMMRPTLRKN